jgi:hypothetical protein
MSQAFRSLVEIKIPELDLTTEAPLELEIAAVQGGTANLILPLYKQPSAGIGLPRLAGPTRSQSPGVLYLDLLFR